VNQKLIDVLTAVGKPVETYRAPDGSGLLVLPYGGRLLGLYAPHSEENFYWTHPVLESEPTARAFYGGQEWHNSGGDRTWLAPEADIFFPEFPRLSKYFQPRQLDPGNYVVTHVDGRICLTNRLSLTLSRSGQNVDLEMTKSYGPAANPLRCERGLEDVADVEYAGYSQVSTLAMLGGAGTPSAAVGLWNLVQMPHEGELLIPTYHRSEPRLIMGKIGPQDLTVENHLIRYRMRAAGEHKLSIRATATSGRVGYLYSTGSRWALIVRNFFVNPSGEYVDSPWDDVSYTGFCVQACNVKSGLGSFSELEYHIPAIGVDADAASRKCTDTATVWAYRGAEKNILAIARILLGPEV
jgi:hypothetical protein